MFGFDLTSLAIEIINKIDMGLVGDCNNFLNFQPHAF